MIAPAWMAWPETRTLIGAFAGRGELRFVGGAVRDALLGRDVTDVDAATPLLPDQVMALLERAGIRPVPTGIDHGTVTAVIAGKHFEITTLRKDTACDGRHAEVAYTADWEEDAARRDFTMNALYLSPEGKLFDYHGGEADAKAGRLRFIGDADARIREDYLRILRLFRFHAHYGKAPLDKTTLAVCGRLASHIASLSGERVRHEMLKLLSAPDPLSALTAMQECGALAHAIGFAPDLKTIAHLSASPQGEREILRLAALLAGDPAQEPAVGERWKLSNDVKYTLKALLAGAQKLDAAMPLAQQKHWLRQWGKTLFRNCVQLRAAASGGDYAGMLTLADTWDIPKFPLSGKDLLALGVVEGRIVGEILAGLEKRWEESDYTLSREALLATLSR